MSRSNHRHRESMGRSSSHTLRRADVARSVVSNSVCDRDCLWCLDYQASGGCTKIRRQRKGESVKPVPPRVMVEYKPGEDGNIFVWIIESAAAERKAKPSVAAVDRRRRL